jgi:molybdenum cofactor cytidylyltransferase
MTTFALIPAAGKSLRMGRPKLSLPLGDSTVLGNVIAALRRARIADVLFVVGPHVRELISIVEAAGADFLFLEEETPDMRATVELGLKHLEASQAPLDSDNLLLVLGDQPTLNADVVQLLLEARAANPQRSVVVPTHQGKRGHPLLIDWKHFAGIRALPRGEGLNAYLKLQATQTLEVPTVSAGVLQDGYAPGLRPSGRSLGCR